MTFNGAIEDETFEKFRNRVKDLQRSDGTLHRFLKARNNHPQSAELMLRNSLEWRKQNDVDNALNWSINTSLYEKFPMEFPGVDFNNRAVIYIGLGCWPIRQMIEGGYKEEMYRNIYFGMEQTMCEIKKTGEQCTLISDLAESTYWKFAHYETMQQIFKVFRDFEANYPERLAEAFIINVPSYLDYAWTLLKPLLNGPTLSKVKFLGSNHKKYMPILLQKIPASSMPARLQKFVN